MEEIRVNTQHALDEATARQARGNAVRILVLPTEDGSYLVVRESSHVEARESSRVVARESSRVEARESSRVVARESSLVVAWGSSHIVARESSHVVAWESSHVVARESSHVVACESSHVEAWESSHVVARESSHVVARESSHVEATKFVAVQRHDRSAIVTGGVLIDIEPPKTPQEWCDYYGVPVRDGVAVLFKGVDDSYRSPRGGIYAPGSIPSAPDWDDGKLECGGGLHFSPVPAMTLEFHPDATRFVACPVRLDDIVVHWPAEFPHKIKARACCAPVWECTRDGDRIEQSVVAAAAVPA